MPALGATDPADLEAKAASASCTTPLPRWYWLSHLVPLAADREITIKNNYKGQGAILTGTCLSDRGKGIRSNTMSHITFKMCQFVLIIHVREYHYDFDLDTVVE